MRDLEKEPLKPATLDIEKISLKDPFRMVHRAMNHWSSAIRYVSLLKLEKSVPEGSDFAKSALLPALIDSFDSVKLKRSKLEARLASKLTANLLRFVCVPEDKELVAGKTIAKAFSVSKDFRTKVSLTVAAERLNYLSTDMVAFIGHCKKDDISDHSGEVGALLVTHGKKENDGLSLIYDAFYSGQSSPEVLARSFLNNTHSLWNALQSSYDSKVFLGSLKLLECLVENEDRERLSEVLYKRGSDESIPWERVRIQASLAFLRNSQNKKIPSLEVKIGDLSRRLFIRPIEIFNEAEEIDAIDSFATCADMSFAKLYELVISGHLPGVNMPFIQKLFRSYPLQAQYADIQANATVAEEKQKLEMALDYGDSLNKVTIDSFHEKFLRLSSFWDTVVPDVVQGIKNLTSSDSIFREDLKAFLDKQGKNRISRSHR